MNAEYIIYIIIWSLFLFAPFAYYYKMFFDASPGERFEVSRQLEVLVDRSCGTLALFGVYSMIGMQVRMMGMMKS